MRRLILGTTLVLVLAAAPVAASAPPAAAAVGLPVAVQAVVPAKVLYKFKNCTAMNKVYPHGVGKTTARDHTSGSTPVTTFKKSTTLYKKIVGYRSGLDRDHDGVACEKA
jgi:hypothetical protein